MVDRGFLEQIHCTIICYLCEMLCHAPAALQTGIYIKPPDFKHDVDEGKVSKSLRVLSMTEIANGSRKTDDLFAGQKNT